MEKKLRLAHPSKSKVQRNRHYTRHGPYHLQYQSQIHHTYPLCSASPTQCLSLVSLSPFNSIPTHPPPKPQFQSALIHQRKVDEKKWMTWAKNQIVCGRCLRGRKQLSTLRIQTFHFTTEPILLAIIPPPLKFLLLFTGPLVTHILLDCQTFVKNNLFKLPDEVLKRSHCRITLK